MLSVTVEHKAIWLVPKLMQEEFINIFMKNKYVLAYNLAAR